MVAGHPSDDRRWTAPLTHPDDRRWDVRIDGDATIVRIRARGGWWPWLAVLIVVPVVALVVAIFFGGTAVFFASVVWSAAEWSVARVVVLGSCVTLAFIGGRAIVRRVLGWLAWQSWVVTGQETVVVRPGRVDVEIDGVGIGRRAAFEVDAAPRVRAEPFDGFLTPRMLRGRFAALGAAGSLGVDLTGVGRARFGIDLTPAEADEIVREIGLIRAAMGGGTSPAAPDAGTG